MKNLIACVLLGGLVAPAAIAEQLCMERANFSTPTSRYVFNDGGALVTDSVTGLGWQRCLLGQVFNNGGTSTLPHDDTCTDAPGTKLNWPQSLSAAAAFNAREVAAGRFGLWRVPNVKELATTQELKCLYPAVNTLLFPGLPRSSSLWSSTTTFNLGTPTAWLFSLDSGSIGGGSIETATGYVRLVRDAP